MALDSTHPLFDALISDWTMLRDMYQGERTVKDKGIVYLPATAGMKLDGMKENQDGYNAYQDYKMRAVFHDYISEAVEMYIGLMMLQPASIQLPKQMEPLREHCGVQGESIDLILRKINAQQLITGRAGVLADLPVVTTNKTILPRVSIYFAETVHNWDETVDYNGIESLNFVAINESNFELDKNTYKWNFQEKYKILRLNNGKYEQGNYRDKEFLEGAMTLITHMGKAIDEIPFVFINSKDIVAEPDRPPLLGLANLTMAIYRGEADYRQNLYMQGQDTLVIVGNVRNPDGKPDENSDAIRTGAGSRIDIDQGGDAKYIGVGSEGLDAQRQCLEDDKKRATVKAGQLISAFNAKEESGTALKTRLGAQTATLTQIANAGAEGLQTLLRKVAKWIGANPEEVIIKPNVKFADLDLTAQEIVYLMTARTMGAPISLETIHSLMGEREITKMAYEDETSLIEKEDEERLKKLIKNNKALNQDDLGNNELENENTGI